MSRIQQLPAEIKARLDELLRAGVPQKAILDQLAGLLASAGEPPVSRSSLNRYASRMEAVGSRIREAREVADAWTARIGEAATGNVGAYTIEMLRTLVFDISFKAIRGEEVGAETVQQLALSMQRLERASQLSAARERALREEVAAQAAGAAEQAARQQGLSPDAAALIRAAVEGAPAGGA